MASRLTKPGIAIALVAGSVYLAVMAARKLSVGSSDFMPHGYCYLWNPRILWLNVVSDGLITLSYYTIPVILIYFINKNRNIPFNRIFWMFGTFILACGTTHLMEIWNVWHGNYMLAGIIKGITAAVSLLTAGLLIPLAPNAISVPDRIRLQNVNLELEQEIAERKLAERSARETLAASGAVLQELVDQKEEREIRKLNEELEERLAERTAQLAAANQELEAFTYSVSHDLRAPLRHIGGFSRILIEDFGAAMNPEARRHLQRIQDGTQRMGLLVDELLNLARLGRYTVALQTPSLNLLIDDVISLLQPDTEGRAIDWKIGHLPSVNCDPILTKQVFQNLIANALKFTRTRERALIEISHSQENGQTVIFVRDNGVGFNMKYQDKLFGVFQRLHRAEDFEGTGIGLATVQRIVHKHGGRAWAEAELDKGATFYFTLAAPEAISDKLHNPDEANLNDAATKHAAVGAQS